MFLSALHRRRWSEGRLAQGEGDGGWYQIVRARKMAPGVGKVVDVSI